MGSPGCHQYCLQNQGCIIGCNLFGLHFFCRFETHFSDYWGSDVENDKLKIVVTSSEGVYQTEGDSAGFGGAVQKSLEIANAIHGIFR